MTHLGLLDSSPEHAAMSFCAGTFLRITTCRVRALIGWHEGIGEFSIEWITSDACSLLNWHEGIGEFTIEWITSDACSLLNRLLSPTFPTSPCTGSNQGLRARKGAFP